jgi:glycosyltransferase involved in cell wall biosynthesis
MSKNINYSLIIPCFNEQDNLLELSVKIHELLLKRANMEVIFVDNGSTDNSSNLFKSIKNTNSRIYVQTIKINIGYGNGLLEGMKIAQGSVIVWTHADLQCNPEDVERAIKEWEASSPICDSLLVKGRRTGRGIIATSISWVMSFVNLLVNRIWISDVNGQPNLMKIEAISVVPDLPLDATFELHLFSFLRKCSKYRFRYIEVEFPDRVNGIGANERIINKLQYVIKTIQRVFIIRGKIENYQAQN